MAIMVLSKRACTRITLALDIVRKMNEGPYCGYHQLGTVKHRIDLCDVVSVEDAPVDEVECADPAVPRDGRNLCLKAVDRIRTKTGVDRHVRITIEKRIPVMGGLAGGSADAAATMFLINGLWELRLDVPELIALGRMTGMDVPYYFMGGTAFDDEAGQTLEPIAARCRFVFVLACPGFGVSTKDAYAGVDLGATGRMVAMTGELRRALVAGDRGRALGLMHNDFELSLFPRLPRLMSLKQELLDAGCSAAFLTGSGSTVVGVVGDMTQAAAVQKAMTCRTLVASTLSEK
jgi:4-diphosphocytidyl-2-C-methyl-D-erythritol kinase